MKAIVQNGYGSTEHVSVKEVERPRINDDQVLVKVRASSVNAGDLFTVKGSPAMIRFSAGFPRPKDFILGWDVAGVVEEVGAGVDDLVAGDEIFGSCESAFAEYAAVKRSGLARKPAGLAFEAAAAVPTAALTALQQLRDNGGLRKGERVLVLGAAGGVGSFAVQIAKMLGASVTGLCRTDKMDFVRSIGADDVIDYTAEDFTRGPDRFDLILDNSGQVSFSRMKRVLTPTGRLVPNSGHGGMSHVIAALVHGMFSKKVTGMRIAKLNREDLDLLAEMLEKGDIRPIIHEVYPFEEAAKAIDALDGGDVMGKVVVAVA
ncbi:MAG: NAD(P)-dependent alcohol dehydrogenase [Candidatus Sulfomarinibacteraceae bacterium]